MQKATLAGGCFWCTEAVFRRIDGVENLISGFTGGNIKNPPYREVVMGRTGHAEAIQFEFDPEKVSYEELLVVFFTTHDPTTLNRQQNDVGTQYRSAVFYHSEEQKAIAEKIIKQFEQEEIFEDPIVTEITPAGTFYEAEPEHLEYYDRNPDQPYCKFIIDPKIDKLKNKFSHKLKQQYAG